MYNSSLQFGKSTSLPTLQFKLGYQVFLTRTRHIQGEVVCNFCDEEFFFYSADFVLTKALSLKISMQWFMGSIPEAIAESRRKGLVFIVYIEGW